MRNDELTNIVQGLAGSTLVIIAVYGLACYWSWRQTRKRVKG